LFSSQIATHTDIGGAEVETRRRIDHAQTVHALHLVALDLTDIEEIQVCPNGVAREL
jgi:hypothetical protein